VTAIVDFCVNCSFTGTTVWHTFERLVEASILLALCAIFPLQAISVQDIATAKERFNAMTKVAPLMAAALRSRFSSDGPFR
jgi:hypothetical protein